MLPHHLLMLHQYSGVLSPSPFPLQSAKALSQALNEIVNCLPGQREMEEALRVINQAMQEAEVQKEEEEREE